MHESLRVWFSLCLALVVFVRAAAQEAGQATLATADPRRYRVTVPVYPAAARVFPSAQFASACGIINIQGLGPGLDGDYTLVDELAPDHEGKPAWIGTSVDRPYHLLSWQPEARAWAIGVHGSRGVYRAFVQIDSDLPPAYSSRWQSFTEDPYAFEEVGDVVSIVCPGPLYYCHYDSRTLRIY